MKCIVHSLKDQHCAGPTKIETPLHHVTSIAPVSWGDVHSRDTFTIVSNGGSSEYYRVTHIEVFP